MADYTEILRKLALNDRGFVDTVLGMAHDTVEVRVSIRRRMR